MENIVARRKNSDVGKQVRDQRVPVMMSVEERAKLDDAAGASGLGLSTYLRVKALEASNSQPKSSDTQKSGA